jgi:alpha,alpha-trehalase
VRAVTLTVGFRAEPRRMPCDTAQLRTTVGHDMTLTIDPRDYHAVIFRLDSAVANPDCIDAVSNSTDALVRKLHDAGLRVDEGGRAESDKSGSSSLRDATVQLGVPPERCVVIAGSDAGVSEGRRAGFALVIGVDRTGHPEQLRRRGADVVVDDLADVKVCFWDRRVSTLPDALQSYAQIAVAAALRHPVVLLDTAQSVCAPRWCLRRAQAIRRSRALSQRRA